MAMVARIAFLFILVSVAEFGRSEYDNLGQAKYEGKDISPHSSRKASSSRTSSSSSQVYYESAGSPTSSPSSSPSSFAEAGYDASHGGVSDGYDPSYKPPPPAARARHHVPVSGSNPASDNMHVNRKPPVAFGN